MTEDSKKITLKSITRPDVPTASGHLYPREVIERAVEEVQERVASGRMLGGLGNSSDGKTRIDSVSHKVSKVRLTGDAVEADIEVLPTVQGQTLKALLQSGSAVNLSMRALGTVRDVAGKTPLQVLTEQVWSEIEPTEGSCNTKPYKVVDHFEIISFDIVAPPEEGP